MGLLLIVFLGAVVTELIRGAAEQRLRPADQLPAVLALLSIMGIWRLYFDEAHTLPALLAERSGRAGTVLAWAYTHLPLTLALSVLSVGFGLGIAEEGPEADRHERLLVGAALAGLFVSLTLLRFFSVRPLNAGTLTPVHLRAVLSFSSVARLVGAALVLLLIAVPVSTTGFQAACTLITLGVAYLSWLDPVRTALNQLEDRLSDGSEAAALEDAQSEDAQSEDDQPAAGPSAVASEKQSKEGEAS